ncbi:SDR family oxidoreductase [Geothermobacter hydrogeniphilus]|uniref:NAD(P)-dependent oxidoreductase n=1 Tax=Geothermobacter hydrogeniphilus TaxID=1969733 RepID=A0A1X0Y411_9BACT|nr:SDR family oxidoreductase [Geothermobacter hydrogeniphilus]ORJ59792.1 NAD(P)-dependent oxidoreductase [Geothermobacter hydrogeniphilus]
MRTVFITGASAGFGAACARRFAAAGDRLVLAARRLDKLQALKSELGDAPVYLAELDVRDSEAVRAVVAALPTEFAAVDVLVNNAGLAVGLEPAWEVDLDDWERMIDTNIKGLAYCTRALLGGMVERRRGHVINIGSIAGSWPYAGGNVYGATKAFVQQFTRNLRTDLHGTGVRATCIEPGMAETEFSQVRFKGDDEKAAGVYKGTRALTAEDIAECVFWCAGLPEHVNINQLEVMPTEQTWGATMVYREQGG